jgi:hypothetical protein
MGTRALLTIVAGLLLLSAGLNVLQFRNFDSRQDEWRKTFAIESLHRLGISRTILVDFGDSFSVKGLNLLHGQLLMDLTRVQPAISNLSPAYQERLNQIRVDLNEFRAIHPEVFSRDNMVMDDSMYSRYIGWISDGFSME